jgi:hypothetical protein
LVAIYLAFLGLVLNILNFIQNIEIVTLGGMPKVLILSGGMRDLMFTGILL